MISSEQNQNPETNLPLTPEEPNVYGQVDGVPGGATPFGIGNSTGDVEYEDIGPKPLNQEQRPKPNNPPTKSSDQ